MKTIATTFCDFDTLIKNHIYVDKTDLLWRLVSGKEDRNFFISRPRRFGKSLLLSTLEAIFRGRRDLFKGLKISKMKYDWTEYPVVMLDMSKQSAETVEGVRRNLYVLVDRLVKEFKLKDVDKAGSPGAYLGIFFEELAKQSENGKFVVLIDEYDVPLQGFLNDRKAIAQVRKLMHDFYVQLKAHSKNIRFMMMTGVTKLTKLSVFSGLNTPKDLTMHPGDFATLLGYTPKEIERFFPKQLDKLARKLKTDRKGALNKLLGWYDSYRFSPDSPAKVCNPISIGCALSEFNIRRFWMNTATASLIYERLNDCGQSPASVEGVVVPESELDVCDALTMPVVPLMYQGGYLTIKDVVSDPSQAGQARLRLGMPNEEVREAVRDGWFAETFGRRSDEMDSLANRAKRLAAEGDIDTLVCEALFAVYAKIPPQWKIRSEADAKRHFTLFMEMIGANPLPEMPSARGYADAIIETKKAVYVFEFKYAKSPAAAIRQIRDRGYANAYRNDKRPVTLVGIKFDPKVRNITIPKIEAL